MKDYQLKFIEFALAHEVLQFGDFKLKSGRMSPYFFNAGRFNTGAVLSELGGYYADALVASRLSFDLLFGPAYKGIPLVAATAIAFAAHHRIDVPFAFNRKHAKDHGEGGVIVGAALAGRAVIVDDVITAGTAIKEVVDLFASYPVTLAGVLVAIDRQERGKGDESAIREIEREYGVCVMSVVKLDDIIEFMGNKPAFAKELPRITRYRDTFGASS